MSLKFFHIVFIIISILLCGGIALWAFQAGTMPVVAWVSLASGGALIAYFVYFLNKTKRIIL